LLAVVFLCPACSGGLNKVSGKVLFQGKPMKGAVVAFHLKGETNGSAPNPTGITDENGVFTLSTVRDSGAPAGEYLVTVILLNDPAASAGATSIGLSEGKAKSVDRFQGRYSNPATSGLTAVIKSGENNELEPFNLN
jgi:hypothetical protein